MGHEIAHLVHPSGKQVGEAEKYFSQVFEAMKQPHHTEALPPLVKATILINAGAGRALDERLIQQALSELKVAAKQTTEAGDIKTLQAAIQYDQARHLAASDQPSDRESAWKRMRFGSLVHATGGPSLRCV